MISMTNSFQQLRRSLYTLLAILLVTQSLSAYAEDTPPLTVKTYQASGSSFHVSATLISGKQQAILIDTGFTRADALRISAAVLDSGKTLSHILISNADPDYYFGAQQIQQFFPQAKIVSTSAVRQRISAKMQAKLAYWGPRLAANAPPALVLPEALAEDQLQLEGHVLEIRGTQGLLAHRPYVWIPSIRALVGNVAIFNRLHVWTADTPTPAEQQAWLLQLQEMRQLKPALVVAGHMHEGSAQDSSSLDFTETYLRQFQNQAALSRTSAELIQRMQLAYPELGLPIALELGAKVAKGEIKW